MKTTSLVLMSATLAMVACSTTPKKEEMADDLYEMKPVTPSEMQGYAEAADDQALLQARRLESLEGQRLIYFAFDDDNLSPEGQARVVEHAEYLVANPEVKLRLEGHADERGSREYNMALGERRAKNIKRALLLRGVAIAQLNLVSYGEERPAVLGAQRESSFAKNRRVEFNYQTGSLARAPLSYDHPVPADEAMTASRPRVN